MLDCGAHGVWNRGKGVLGSDQLAEANGASLLTLCSAMFHRWLKIGPGGSVCITEICPNYKSVIVIPESQFSIQRGLQVIYK